MATLAELEVNITASTKQFDKAIKDTKTETEKAGKGIEKTTTSIKKLVSGVAVAALVAKIGQIAAASIDAAKEAQETRNKFNTAFKGIEEDADAVAKNLADNYGLSTTESEKLLSGTADLVKGFGANATAALETSEEIQKMSVDLASYNNLQGGATRASEILTKAYLGERDSLVSLGIKISENDVKQELLKRGQEGLTGQALMLAKGNITLELAMKQSGDAIGDFARSTGSYAQESIKATAAAKNLQVELGRALLPTATSVKRIFGELTGRLADYIKKINDLRTAEKAQELGISTKQQDLLLLKSKEEELKKQLKAEKDLFELAAEDESFTSKFAKQQAVILSNQIDGVKRQIYYKELSIDKEQEVQDKQQEKADAEQQAFRDAEDAERVKQANYQANLDFLNKIIEENKSEIEVIDEEISTLERLDAKDEETRAKQLEAITLLQTEKQALLDEETQAKTDADNAEIEREREKAATIGALIEKQKTDAINAEEAKRLKREESLQNTIDKTKEYASATIDIANQIFNTANNLIEAEKIAKIAMLDENALGEEAYQKKKAEYEKEAAVKSWEIQKKQLVISKANSLIEIAINTAVGISKALAQGGVFGIASGIAVGAAGVAQASAVLSQPEPPRPAFAKGGVATSATTATVGEAGGEVMLGMGAAGTPLINELADKIASRQGGQSIVINLNGNGIFSRKDLDDFARKLRPSTVRENQRLGIGV
ncbi:MAG: hypothetical protein GY928_08225 [Colwellia sp.]|nr:hypothetical protein [Colwellia sp.]